MVKMVFTMFVSSLIIRRAMREIASKVDLKIIDRIMDVYSAAREITSLSKRIDYMAEQLKNARFIHEWELLVWVTPYACEVMYVNLDEGCLQPRNIVPSGKIINLTEYTPAEIRPSAEIWFSETMIDDVIIDLIINTKKKSDLDSFSENFRKFKDDLLKKHQKDNVEEEDQS